MQRGQRKRSSALPGAAAGREGAHTCAGPRGGSGVRQSPPGPPVLPAHPAPCPACPSRGRYSRFPCAAVPCGKEVVWVCACRRLLPPAPRRCPPAAAAPRQRASSASRHTARSGILARLGWARHGSARTARRTGRRRCPALYRAGWAGRGGRRRPSAHWPGRRRGPGGGRHRPAEPRRVGGPAPLERGGRAILYNIWLNKMAFSEGRGKLYFSFFYFFFFPLEAALAVSGYRSVQEE